jgi:hypothetical protein
MNALPCLPTSRQHICSTLQSPLCAVDLTGTIPPGNAPGETKWQQRRAKAAKSEIRLTPGKGLQDLTCTLEELIDQVVKTNKVRWVGGGVDGWLAGWLGGWVSGWVAQVAGWVGEWVGGAGDSDSPQCACVLIVLGKRVSWRTSTAGRARGAPCQLRPKACGDERVVQVVAFVKGTRTAPQCGFSHKMLTILSVVSAFFFFF